MEDDPNLSAADKRYERVKRWTKKTNLFEKDFIVVPINEHSHWFVAVICFPGKEGCWNIETNQPVDEPASQVYAANAQQLRKKRRPRDGTKRVMQIGSTSIIPLKGAVGAGLLEKLGIDDDQVMVSVVRFSKTDLGSNFTLVVTFLIIGYLNYILE